MNWTFLVSAFTDPYERKARAFPGLLVILPLLISMCCMFGPARPLPTALLALVVTAGGVFALAALARVAGKRLEEKLVVKWGGMPTTLALRHRDSRFNTYTKQGYHQRLAQLTGIELPTAEEEARNPADADARYETAVARLRNMTRGPQFPHLRRENIAYGFYRNALALKPHGLGAALVGFALGAQSANAFALQRPYVRFENLFHPGPLAAIALVTAAVMAVVWLSFTKANLRRIGFAYAERLFECIDALPQQHASNQHIRNEGQL